MVEHKSVISIDEAIRRIAAASAASNGDEWLGPPTARQLRLIARHIDGSSKPEPASIMPSRMSFVVSGQRWTKYPADPALVAEVERALYQRDLYEDQCEAALDWLVSHGFDTDAQDIDGDVLERELRKHGDAVPEIVATPVGGAAAAKQAWTPKPGKTLTATEAAVLDALNHLFPDGVLAYRAKARDDRIVEWLKQPPHKIDVSRRTIQRAVKKIKSA
jgi:hypothetical protein